MDRYELYTEYQTKEKKIILGLDFHFSFSFSNYIFSSFYAKYYIFFHPNNRNYLIWLSAYLRAQPTSRK